MRFRKLRIAWSVICGIACVLLIVLWVRSYWWQDSALVPYTEHGSFHVFSLQGCFGVATQDFPVPELEVIHSQITFREIVKDDYGHVVDSFWIRVLHFTFSTSLYIPYWMPTAAFLALAGTPWTFWKFTLRTLLIATTLVAVVLGLVVWHWR